MKISARFSKAFKARLSFVDILRSRFAFYSDTRCCVKGQYKDSIVSRLPSPGAPGAQWPKTPPAPSPSHQALPACEGRSGARGVCSGTAAALRSREILHLTGSCCSFPCWGKCELTQQRSKSTSPSLNKIQPNPAFVLDIRKNRRKYLC